uniref:Heparan-alpha-glucosaminide N-acetyltransferase-like n=1 Tax=Cyprinus carpio TaxID=7962 RepID=A0A8C1GD23_CYPCA
MKKEEIFTLRKNRKEEAVRSDVMASEREYRWTVCAVIVLLIALCTAHVTDRPASSHPHRKTSVLKMDEASLSVTNEIENDMMLYVVSDHCYKCLPKLLGIIPARPASGTPTTVGFVVGTQHALTLQLNSTSANLEPKHIHYECFFSLLFLAILFAFLVFAFLAALSAIWNTVKRLDVVTNLLHRLGSTVETERLINSELGTPNRLIDASMESIIPATTGRRLRSLDTFRGLALVIMVFVNYGGGRYWFFRHESWNGKLISFFTVATSMFVFIMGTSIGLSLSGSLRRGVKRTHLQWRIFWRSLQLFLFGVIIVNPNYCQGPLSWDSLRIPGVLQRLGFTYLVVAILDLMVARDRLTNLSSETCWYSVHDVCLYWPAWLIVIALEAIWLCLTFLLPVPDCPTGYLGPGGIGDFGQYQNCTGGAAGYIDRWLLGNNHIYQTPSSRVVYQSVVPFDPEGVLGSINSVLMAFLGLQAGKILLHYRDQHRQIITRFLIWGFILGIISAVLTKCSRNDGFIPVNKNLSLSYVTTLSCFAFVALVVFYYLVDVKKWWSGAPFYYPGMNSILVYVGHEVFEEYFPFRWKMANSQSHAEHLAQNLVATSIWVIIAYLLYRKKIFWKI